MSFPEFPDFAFRLFLGAQGNEVDGGEKVGKFLHLSSDDASVKSEEATFVFRCLMITANNTLSLILRKVHT